MSEYPQLTVVNEQLEILDHAAAVKIAKLKPGQQQKHVRCRF